MPASAVPLSAVSSRSRAVPGEPDPSAGSAGSDGSAGFTAPSADPVAFVCRPSRTLHLAAAIDGREQDAAYYVELARLAERGALDFVTLGGCGGFAGSGGFGADPAPRDAAGGGAAGAGGEEAAPDALAVLARVAPATDRIGLVPALTAGNGDPFTLALAVATLDWVSHGRAGWTVAVPGEREPEGAAVRRRAAERRFAERAEARRRATEEAAEAVARCWEDRGAPTGRPVVVADATPDTARAAAARRADVAFVRVTRPERAAAIRVELRRRAAEAGRDPERLLVFADLRVDLGGGELGPEPGTEVAPVADGTGAVRFNGGPVDLAELIADWQRSGAVDGFHIRPVEPRRDLERFVNGTVALLQHRGLFRSFHPGATLREHLGLHRPEQRLTVAGGPAS